MLHTIKVCACNNDHNSYLSLGAKLLRAITNGFLSLITTLSHQQALYSPASLLKWVQGFTASHHPLSCLCHEDTSLLFCFHLLSSRGYLKARARNVLYK